MLCVCAGNIDKFRDLPLSLQVLATERFFEAMSRDVEAMGNDMAGECRDVDESECYDRLHRVCCTISHPR